MNVFARIPKLDHWIFGLFLFLLPWQTIWITREISLLGSKWEYGTLGIFASEILLGICVLLVLKKRLPQMKFPVWMWTPDRQFVFLILLSVLYVYASSLWAIDSDLAQQQARHVLEGVEVFFLFLLYREYFFQLLLAFVAGSIPVSILSIWQFLTQQTVSSSWFGMATHPAWMAGTAIISSDATGRWLRAYGTFSHPNVLGGYIVVVLFVCGVLWLEKQKNRWIEIYVLVVTILATTALFFSFSRSAYGAAFLFVVYFIWRLRKEKARLLFPFAILATGVSLAILFSSLLFVRTTVTDISEQRSIQERGSYMKDAISLIQAVPIFGVGAGNYTRAVCDTATPGWQCQPVHTIFLLFFAELGLVGVGLFFAILYFARRFMKTCEKVSAQKKELVILAGLILGILGLFDHYLYTSFTGLILVFVVFGAVLCPHFLHRQ